MRTKLALTAFLFLLGFSSISIAEKTAQEIKSADLQEKVTATIGDEFVVEFKRDGARLINPLKSKMADVKKLSVQVKLDLTSQSPFPPPRAGATRPFLTVQNNFDEALSFSLSIRLKGSKDFIEIDTLDPVPAGEYMNKCWEFDSELEEVALSNFALVPEWVINQFGRPDPHSANWSDQPEVARCFQPSGIGGEFYRVGEYTILHNYGIYWSNEEDQDDSKDMEASVIVYKGKNRLFVARGYKFDEFQTAPDERSFSFRYWSGVQGDEQLEQFQFDASTEVLKLKITTKNTQEDN